MMFRNRYAARLVVLALLLWLFLWGAYNARMQSPTMDEQNHIARGYALLRTGDPRLSVEHPPLINGLEALPLFLLDPLRMPTDDWSWEVSEWYRFADLLMWHLSNPVELIVFLARLPIMGLTILLAALVYRWASELWGRGAGVFALALIALDPNIMAHGNLATTDLGQTFAVFWTGYMTWHTARSPSWGRYALIGVAMGAMLATKLSALAFAGVWGLLLVAYAARDLVRRPPQPVLAWWRSLCSYLGRFILLGGLALIVLWGTYAFQTGPLREHGRPVPMSLYWHGLASILHQTQGGRPSYLLGRTSVHGFWTYFPITFIVKTPIATLLTLLLAFPVSLYRRAWRADVFLLAPVLVYGISVMQSALNLGYRHLLPLLPFIYVWAAQVIGVQKIGGMASDDKWQVGLKAEGWVRGRLVLFSRMLPWALALILALECLWIAPYFLSYFNVLAGGPDDGWHIIADSNIDWGQDLKRLKSYLLAHNLDAVKLSWFGSSYPEFYGITYEPLPGLPHHFDLWNAPPFDVQSPGPGVYVISVSNLVEIPFEEKRVFAYFRAREPDARVGYSIYIYNIPSSSHPEPSRHPEPSYHSERSCHSESSLYPGSSRHPELAEGSPR
jgi:hypothetical protein